MKNFFEQNQVFLENVRKKAGMDSEKIQKVVTIYLQIARDNQVNLDELNQIMSDVRETVVQSLNKVSISALPEMISVAAKKRSKNNIGYTMPPCPKETVEKTQDGNPITVRIEKNGHLSI